MEEFNYTNDNMPMEPKQPARPLQLTVMCILSFVGGGLTLLSYMVYALFYDVISVIVKNDEIPKSIPHAKENILTMLSAGKPFFVIGLILNIASLTGVIYMWNQMKKGFHIYTIAQILMLVSMMYFLKVQGFPTGELFLSGVFVFFYAMNLKAMK